MTTLYEVYIEANEPWTEGQRAAVDSAVMEYIESGLDASYAGSPDFDADAQLTAYDEAYIGYAGNAHEDADGFVFGDQASAQRFADAVRSHTRVLGMTVAQSRLGG